MFKKVKLPNMIDKAIDAGEHEEIAELYLYMNQQVRNGQVISAVATGLVTVAGAALYIKKFVK